MTEPKRKDKCWRCNCSPHCELELCENCKECEVCDCNNCLNNS